MKPGDSRGLFLLPVSKKQTVSWEIRGMRSERRVENTEEKQKWGQNPGKEVEI